MTISEEQILITQEGLDKLKSEYEELTKQKRPVIVDRLTNSRQDGDLAENSEYSQAKEELSFIDGRINELEEVINKASIISGSHKNCGSIALGCKVTVKSSSGGSHLFHLVGEWEADPAVKKISHTSPLGKSLLGKKVGEIIEVEAPVGKIVYTILKID
jgi:transcription elongation factor GreA